MTPAIATRKRSRTRTYERRSGSSRVARATNSASAGSQSGSRRVRVDHEAADGANGLLERLSLDHDLEVRLDAPFVVGVEDSEEEVVLAGEVRVDRALRVAGLLGDLVEGRAVEAAS